MYNGFYKLILFLETWLRFLIAAYNISLYFIGFLYVLQFISLELKFTVLGLKVEFPILIKMKSSRSLLFIRINKIYNSRILAKQQLGISICPIIITSNHIPKHSSFLTGSDNNSNKTTLIFQLIYILSIVIQNQI